MGEARDRVRLWGAALAVWTAFAFLETTRMYTRVVAEPPRPGIPRSWLMLLPAHLPWWWLWALLTPVVFALAARWPLHGERWGRHAAAHTAASLVVSVVHLTLAALAFHAVVRGAGAPARFTAADQIRTYLNGSLVPDVVTYWAVVGAYHAVEFARRWRESALAAARHEARAARLELGLAEARLQALRMELNPHFLFNTLNAIAGLVRRQEGDAAVGMIARLGDLLRTTLDRDMPQEIPLADELALLGHYLDIERARFGERLVVEVEVDPAARDALVPTLVFQPLVENAIRHGVARHRGPALVRVSAARDGAALRLEVRDTGAGLGGAASRDGGGGGGIGLANTRERLAQLHGEGATLRLEDAPGGGACATVRLPFRAAATAASADAALVG